MTAKDLTGANRDNRDDPPKTPFPLLSSVNSSRALFSNLNSVFSVTSCSKSEIRMERLGRATWPAQLRGSGEEGGSRPNTNSKVETTRQFLKTTSMKSIHKALVLLAITLLGLTTGYAQDPLPSWNDGTAKQSITEFVAKVTKEGSPDFVPPEERIATFDNDGTLWCEQPMYFQLLLALDRVKALSPTHPEWVTEEPFASLLKGDVKAALAGGEKSIVEIVMETRAGMTPDDFDKIVSDWAATAKHPVTGHLFTEMVYQPMLELLAYLRANGFKTFIVSG